MKFRSKVKDENNAEISTASLPDIVFLLLFFFMVTATIKTKEERLKIDYPKAQSVTATEQKRLVKEISIGVPGDGRPGSQPLVEVDGHPISLEQLPQWVEAQRASLPEVQRASLIVMLKADEHVSMGLITDVQERLKMAQVRRILYRTLEVRKS